MRLIKANPIVHQTVLFLFVMGVLFGLTSNLFAESPSEKPPVLKGPVTGDDYLKRANDFYRQGDYKSAVVDYTKVLEMNPDAKHVYFYRGNAMANSGQHANAILDYDKVIAAFPKAFDPYYNRGLSLKALGRHEKSIADFTKAIELNPLDIAAYKNRSESWWHLGELEKSDADLQSAKQVQAYISKNQRIHIV